MASARRQRTREAILAAAREQFLSRGFDQTPVNAIAEAAGVSRASLFNHFAGKQALLDALGEALQPRLVQLVEHYAGRPGPMGARIEALFAYAGRVLRDTRPLTRLLLVREGGDDLPAVRAAFARWLVAGQASGEVRTDIDAADLADTLHNTFLASLLGWGEAADEDIAGRFGRRARLLNQILLA